MRYVMVSDLLYIVCVERRYRRKCLMKTEWKSYSVVGEGEIDKNKFWMGDLNFRGGII